MEAEHFGQLWPWPEPGDLKGRVDALNRIAGAAMSEVGVPFVETRPNERNVAPKHSDQAMKAYRLALDSLGIAYELVDVAEYRRRVVERFPDRLKVGMPHDKTWWKKEHAHA